jgi:uncharacterized RDD family membrane protein YckC/type II secretory pathway pseudopilin PulG
MYCQKCGEQNNELATLCVKCGAPLAATAVGSIVQVASGVYAGFWKRFAALFIDYLIVVMLAVAAGGILGFVYGVVSGTPRGAEVWGALAGFVVWWMYYAAMESSQKQATLGKMALGIKVTDQRGARISFGRASGRLFAKLLSAMIFAIGYLMAGFTAKRQALHDMVAGCLVVNNSASPAQLQAGVIAPAMPAWAMVLIVLGVMLIPVGIIGGIAIPAYQDFTLRAKVSEAAGVGGAARVAVRTYYEQNEKWPADLAEALKAAGVAAPVSPHVRRVVVDPGTGAIRVDMAQAALDGKSLRFVPQVEGKTINWTCRSDDVPQRYLPHSCRNPTTRP